MKKEQITIMIKGSVNDMFGEHFYFLKHVYPELKKLCENHNIELDYLDIGYTISEEDSDKGRIVLDTLNLIDLDRTFFICFRGQRLGWVPCHSDIDKLTLDTFPELVNYIGNISITELSMFHALKPFEKYENGKLITLPSVKHALFYFRKPDYVDNLNLYQKLFYTNSAMGENQKVPDLNIAKAKDLICSIKEEFDSQENSETRITIRRYDGIWDNKLNRYDVIDRYTREYAKIKGLSYNKLMEKYGYLYNEGIIGCFNDFKCNGRPLKDIIIEEFMESLKQEFPQNF